MEALPPLEPPTRKGGMLDVYKRQDRSRPFEEPYNGKTFPLSLYDPCLLVVDIEYEGHTEFVYLPDDDIAIDKEMCIRDRCGADH